MLIDDALASYSVLQCGITTSLKAGQSSANCTVTMKADAVHSTTAHSSMLGVALSDPAVGTVSQLSPSNAWASVFSFSYTAPVTRVAQVRLTYIVVNLNGAAVVNSQWPVTIVAGLLSFSLLLPPYISSMIYFFAFGLLGCDAMCATCEGTPSHCLSCSTSTLYLLDTNSSCVANPPQNFLCGADNKCFQCDPLCASCSGSLYFLPCFFFFLFFIFVECFLSGCLCFCDSK